MNNINWFQLAFSLSLENILFAQSERTIRQKTETDNDEDNELIKVSNRRLESRLYYSFGKNKLLFWNSSKFRLKVHEQLISVDYNFGDKKKQKSA